MSNHERILCTWMFLFLGLNLIHKVLRKLKEIKKETNKIIKDTTDLRSVKTTIL